MSISKNSKNWEKFANLILRNRLIFLVLVLITTVLLSSQWKNLKFSYSEANLMPKDHPFNLAYNNFVNVFGEEGNLLIIAINDSAIFEKNNLNSWIKLSESFENIKEVNSVIHLGNIPVISKDKQNKKFIVKSIINKNFETNSSVEKFKKTIFNSLPFYENILFKSKTQTIQTAIYLDKNVVNNVERIDFVNNVFIPLIENFETKTKLDVKVSGMPYIRTMNAQNIMDEIGKFIVIGISRVDVIVPRDINQRRIV